MAFIKYISDAPTKPLVRISGTTISIAEQEWNKAGLQGADFVNLFWDAQTQRIGLASTDEDDQNKFAAKLSRRGVSIAASKFFAKFGIADTQAEGGLIEEDSVIAFKVKSSQQPEPQVNLELAPAPKRRGPRPKNAVEA